MTFGGGHVGGSGGSGAAGTMTGMGHGIANRAGSTSALVSGPGSSGNGDRELPEIRLPSQITDISGGDCGPASAISHAIPSLAQQYESSGDVTPSYSNPPTVFRSLSESGPRPVIPPAPTNGATAIGENDDEEDGDEVEVVQMSEEDRRRAVAEATARRLGLTSGVLDKGKGKARVEPDPSVTSPPLTPLPTRSEHSTTAAQLQTPYLSLPESHFLAPSVHPDAANAASPGLSGEAVGGPEGIGGIPDEEAELEMARLLSVALDQGRPLHLRHPMMGQTARTDSDGQADDDGLTSEELQKMQDEVDKTRRLLAELKRKDDARTTS